MTRLRSVVVVAVIAGSIGLSLAALVLDRMLWPFAQYPMYSTRFGPTTAITRAVGVAADGRELPMPRQVEPTGLMLHVIVSIAQRREDSRERLTRIATAIRTEYERQRAAGRIRGAAIVSVRIYRDTIELATVPHARRATLLAEGPQP